MGKRFSFILTFFSLVSSREFSDAPHSRFWCRDFKLCLLDFLKMLDLALSQIYTRVFYLRKSVALDNAWVKDFRHLYLFSLACFRAFSNAENSRFCCEYPNLCLPPSPNLHTCISLVEVYRFKQSSKSPRLGYAQRDFDQLLVNFQELGR